MLRPEFNIDDVIFILFMASNMLSLIAGRAWGYNDGHDDGARQRRRSERAFRRGEIRTIVRR